MTSLSFEIAPPNRSILWDQALTIAFTPAVTLFACVAYFTGEILVATVSAAVAFIGTLLFAMPLARPRLGRIHIEGETLEPTMETGERQIVPGRRALVTGVRPMVDTADATPRATVHREPHAKTVLRRSSLREEVERAGDQTRPVRRVGRRVESAAAVAHHRRQLSAFAP